MKMIESLLKIAGMNFEF